MNIIRDPDRREVLAASAAAAASTLIAAQAHAEDTAGGDTIRPFRVNVSEDQLVDLRQRLAATDGRTTKRSAMNHKACS